MALATGVSHDLEEELGALSGFHTAQVLVPRLFGGSRLGSRLLLLGERPFRFRILVRKASIQQPTSEPTASTPSAAPKTKKSWP